MKLTAKGDVTWQETFSVDGNTSIIFRAVQEAKDGGYVVAGTRGGGSSGLVAKLDEAGQMGDDCYIVDGARVKVADGPVEDESKESTKLDNSSYEAAVAVLAGNMVESQVCLVP